MQVHVPPALQEQLGQAMAAEGGGRGRVQLAVQHLVEQRDGQSGRTSALAAGALQERLAQAVAAADGGCVSSMGHSYAPPSSEGEGVLCWAAWAQHGVPGVWCACALRLDGWGPRWLQVPNPYPNWGGAHCPPCAKGSLGHFSRPVRTRTPQPPKA